MTQDRPLLGIFLMLGFCVLAPIGDSLAKILGERIPLLQLVVVRFALQALLLSPLVALGGGTARMRGLVGWIALRTALHIVGLGAMFLALRHMPLAETVAIAFVMPFLILLLGWAVLGETVGPRRLAACAAGFAGTLMVVQPTFAEVGAAALLPLVVALAFALFMLITRHIARRIDAVPLQWLSGLMATALLLPLLALGTASPVADLGIVVPGRADLGLLLAMGILGTGAHLVMTWSLRFAPSATLAPMQYLEIPMATLMGWMVFGDLPGGLAAWGIAVTIGAGLYVIWREQQAARRPAPHQAPPAA